MEATLQAIASPVRLAMLRFIWDEEQPSSAIADHLGLSRAATSQHLKVLRDAGLVVARVDANRRLYSVQAERLQELRAYLEHFWGERLDALRRTAEAQAGTTAPATAPPD